MAKVLICIFDVILLALPLTYTAHLPGCRDGWIEVDETASSVPITCNRNSPVADVTWQVRTPQSAQSFNLIGTCKVDRTCNDDRLSRPNATTSIFTLVPSRQQHGYDVMCSDGPLSEATCQLDIVYPPSDSEVSCSIAPSSPSRWQLTASCDVTKAYSSRDNYTCDLRQGSATGPSLDRSSYSSGSSGNFISGTCTLTAAMPTTTGSFSYTVIISPGQKAVTPSGSITVAQPSADPVITCVTGQGQYVPEHTDLRCTCSASDLGHPKGHLRVYRGNSLKVNGSYGDDNVTFTETSVSRADDGTVYRCELEWATNDTPRDTTFTLLVAYGPASTNLDMPVVFDLHPKTPGTLTLTCDATGFKPNVIYSWTGSRCSSVTQRTCSFTPTRNDNGDVISCTAVNTVTSVNRTSASRTLSVHYPPSDPPVITGYSQGEIIYSGQTRNMTCTVRGGVPPVSSVNFICGGQGQEVSGSSSTLSITASRELNGRRCRCSARWKNKSPPWYTLTDDVTITVYYPPSPPSIGHRGQRSPFLAGQSPTLSCFLPDSGNPPASLTFDGHRGGSGQGGVNVTLGPLGESDNGRRVTCEASNAFTDLTSTPVTQDYVLQVYYVSKPIITPLSGDTCDMTSSSTCIVREGGRVHVNCSARSNPPLDTVAWQQSGNTVLDLVASRTLPLSYACSATTRTNGTDDRLPLNNTMALTILTTYAAKVSEFQANGRRHNLTINESSSVTLNCTAVGRPTPTITLTKDGQPIKHVDKGQHVTHLHTATLTYERAEATCDVTGNFDCHVDNDIGGQSTERVTVFVNCPPRQVTDSTEPKDYLDFNGDPLKMHFSLTAFPPKLKVELDYFRFLNSTPKTAQTDLYTFNCDVMETSPNKLDCTLTVANVTRDNVGFYNLTLMNDVGEFSWRFHLDVNASVSNGGNDSQFSIAAAVGGGVAASVILLTAVVVLVLKRRKKGKEADNLDSQRMRQKSSRERKDDDAEMIVNTIYESSDVKDGDAEMIVNTIYESSDVKAPCTRKTSHPSGNAYEDVGSVGPVPIVRQEGHSIVPHGAMSGATPVTDDSSLYAIVNKSKQPVAPAPLKRTSDTTSKPTVKPKPTKKGKGVNPKKKKKQETEVYSNTVLLTMEPKGQDGAVYENCAFQNDETSVLEKPESSKASPLVNADGLVYTTIAFTEDQQRKAGQRPPERETTEYVDIDFGKLARKSD